MEGWAVVCGGGDALNPKRKLKTPRDRPLNSVFASAPKPFLDSGAMLSFGAVGVNKSRNSFSQSFDQEEGGDEYLDEHFNQPEKKKRISVDQVQFLERNFQAENKLEPERKIQLAKELGLQPRQIAIWFQNRRARWKTRQLETDYETLHASYKSLKTNYDNLLEENEKLKAEVLHLKCNGLAAHTEKENLLLCDAKELSQTMPEAALTNVIPEDGGSQVSAVALKNEEQSSAKSDATNVEISTNVVHSAILEMGDLSLVPEFDGSDLSHGCFLPMVEDAHCFPPESSFYHGFPDQDHTFSFWSR